MIVVLPSRTAWDLWTASKSLSLVLVALKWTSIHATVLKNVGTALLYLTVTAPDGLILFLYAPNVGRRYDMTLYRQSGLDQEPQQNSVISGTQHYVYGDSAFIMSPRLQVAFNRTFVTLEQAVFNTDMSGPREGVEWSYKDVKQQFTSMDFSRTLKFLEAPNEPMYKMSALLWNLMVCFHRRGEVGTYFQCEPPTLKEYLFSLQDF